MGLRRFAFITLIIIVLIGAVVLIGASQVSPAVIIVSMISTTIAVATPLTLGALCGIYCERAGVVNIGIEGMMLASAFFGWFGAIYLNTILKVSPFPSLLFGVLVAILTGGLLGLLHAALSVTFKVDQIIGGTVINLLAVGISGFLNRQLFFEKGSIFGGQVPHAPGVLPRIHIPLLADLLGFAHARRWRTSARRRYGGHQCIPNAVRQRHHRRNDCRACRRVLYSRIRSQFRTINDEWSRVHFTRRNDLWPRRGWCPL
jgi:hypothetical protein